MPGNYTARHCSTCAKIRTHKAGKCIVCESDVWWKYPHHTSTNPFLLPVLLLLGWKWVVIAIALVSFALCTPPQLPF